MKTESTLSWQDQFFLYGNTPPDEFLKRFDALLLIDKTGVVDRVSAADLWLVVGMALAAGEGIAQNNREN